MNRSKALKLKRHQPKIQGETISPTHFCLTGDFCEVECSKHNRMKCSAPKHVPGWIKNRNLAHYVFKIYPFNLFKLQIGPVQTMNRRTEGDVFFSWCQTTGGQLNQNPLTFQAARPLSLLSAQHTHKLHWQPCWRSEINLPIVCAMWLHSETLFDLTVSGQQREKQHAERPKQNHSQI